MDFEITTGRNNIEICMHFKYVYKIIIWREFMLTAS